MYIHIQCSNSDCTHTLSSWRALNVSGAEYDINTGARYRGNISLYVYILLEYYLVPGCTDVIYLGMCLLEYLACFRCKYVKKGKLIFH